MNVGLTVSRQPGSRKQYSHGLNKQTTELKNFIICKRTKKLPSAFSEVLQHFLKPRPCEAEVVMCDIIYRYDIEKKIDISIFFRYFSE